MVGVRGTCPIRHPGESRDPLNSFHTPGTTQIALIQWVPAFAGMTVEWIAYPVFKRQGLDKRTLPR